MSGTHPRGAAELRDRSESRMWLLGWAKVERRSEGPQRAEQTVGGVSPDLSTAADELLAQRGFEPAQRHVACTPHQRRHLECARVHGGRSGLAAGAYLRSGACVWLSCASTEWAGWPGWPGCRSPPSLSARHVDTRPKRALLRAAGPSANSKCQSSADQGRERTHRRERRQGRPQNSADCCVQSIQARI
jgi:hypothetical protein